MYICGGASPCDRLERYQSWYLLCMYICGGASPCDRLERYQSWYLLCMYICVSVSPSLPLVCVGQLLPIVYVYLCVSQSFASFSLCRSAGTYCVCIFVVVHLHAREISKLVPIVYVYLWWCISMR